MEFSELKQEVAKVVEEACSPSDDQLLLRLRLALHLPRFTQEQLAERETIVDEVHRLLPVIRARQSDFDWNDQRAVGQLSNLNLHRIDRETADAINERFHYIGTQRNGEHFGLLGAENPPATLLTFAPLDLAHVESVLDDDFSAVVLARAYSFRWAPRNAFSYGFSRAVGQLRQDLPEIDIVLSYVNPNVGFTGASYRASGWQQIGEETQPRYLYLDSNYITRREIIQRFGHDDIDKHEATLSGRLTRSVLPLLPLKLFAFPVSKRAATFVKGADVEELPHHS